MMHEFKIVSEASGDCGSNYCTGHTSYYSICSCGEKLPRYNSESKNIIVQLNHILEKAGLGKIV